MLAPEEIQTLSETDEGGLLVSQFDAFVQSLSEEPVQDFEKGILSAFLLPGEKSTEFPPMVECLTKLPVRSVPLATD